MKKLAIPIIIFCLSITVLSGCSGASASSSSNASEESQSSGNAGYQSPASTIAPKDDSRDTGEDTSNEQTEASTPAETETTQAAPTGEFNFTTTDINGNSVSFSDYCGGKKVIMINFWEPWCGPCIGEMPDLERLYQDYKDQGFLIIGAYTTPDDDGSVTEAIGSTGVTYPCIVAPESMYGYMTGYVPTTFFVDGNGNILSAEPQVGSNSYSGWESILREYL